MDESRLTKEIEFLNSMREQIARRQKELEAEYINDNKIRDIDFEFEYDGDRWKITDMKVMHTTTGRIEVQYVCRRKKKDGGLSSSTQNLYREHFTTPGYVKP